MKMTPFAQTLAMSEAVPTYTETGATAHAKACAYDAGIRVLLTGKDTYGKSFRREAKSLYGAFMQMQAAWGLNRAWLVNPDGTRKLLIVR